MTFLHEQCGTVQRYRRGKCRCDLCKLAVTAYEKKQVARAAHGTNSRYNSGCRCEVCVNTRKSWRSTVPHGTVNRYDSGCRCQECKITKRIYILMWTYGLTREQLEFAVAGFDSQEGKCPLCDQALEHPITGGGDAPEKAACFDHDHVTNKFRCWLCRYCNRNLARFGDSPEGLRLAADRLELAILRNQALQPRPPAI